MCCLMRIFNNKKIIIIIIICIFFIIGVVSLIYVKFTRKDKTYIESFYSDLNYDDLGINNMNGESSEFDKDNTEVENNESNKVIYIHIVGEVKNEGVVKLKEGQRIIDAIEEAGGVTEFADLSKVNLAFVLSDGQKVEIPNVNDNVENFMYVTDNSGDNIIVDNGNKLNEGGDKVNINTASQTELETLTGIGPSTALKIIEYREENGKFKKIEDLKNVSGIGEAKYEAIKDNIVVK